MIFFTIIAFRDNCQESFRSIFLLKLLFHLFYCCHTSAARTSQISSVIPSRQLFLVIRFFFNFKQNIRSIDNRMEIHLLCLGVCQIELFQQRHFCPTGRIGAARGTCPIVGYGFVSLFTRRIEMTHFGFRHL